MQKEFVQINGRKNYELEIEILGVAPYNFCTFIVKAKNKENQPTNIKCRWYKQKSEKIIQDNQSNIYEVSVLDVGFQICLDVHPLDEGVYGECQVMFGTIQIDPELQSSIIKFICNGQAKFHVNILNQVSLSNQDKKQKHKVIVKTNDQLYIQKQLNNSTSSSFTNIFQKKQSPQKPKKTDKQEFTIQSILEFRDDHFMIIIEDQEYAISYNEISSDLSIVQGDSTIIDLKLQGFKNVKPIQNLKTKYIKNSDQLLYNNFENKMKNQEQFNNLFSAEFIRLIIDSRETRDMIIYSMQIFHKRLILLQNRLVLGFEDEQIKDDEKNYLQTILNDAKYSQSKMIQQAEQIKHLQQQLQLLQDKLIQQSEQKSEIPKQDLQQIQIKQKESTRFGCMTSNKPPNEYTEMIQKDHKQQLESELQLKNQQIENLKQEIVFLKSDAFTDKNNQTASVFQSEIWVSTDHKKSEIWNQKNSPLNYEEQIQSREFESEQMYLMKKENFDNKEKLLQQEKKLIEQEKTVKTVLAEIMKYKQKLEILQQKDQSTSINSQNEIQHYKQQNQQLLKDIEEYKSDIDSYRQTILVLQKQSDKKSPYIMNSQRSQKDFLNNSYQNNPSIKAYTPNKESKHQKMSPFEMNTSEFNITESTKYL